MIFLTLIPYRLNAHAVAFILGITLMDFGYDSGFSFSTYVLPSFIFTYVLVFSLLITLMWLCNQTWQWFNCSDPAGAMVDRFCLDGNDWILYEFFGNKKPSIEEPHYCVERCIWKQYLLQISSNCRKELSLIFVNMFDRSLEMFTSKSG